jgi:sterol desaturase/sphingolipid hydroxylase (fatty acid hydroxylase superfamily)
MKAILAYSWYPIFVALAVLAFGAMLQADVAPVLAAPAAIAVVAVAILLLERAYPARRDWQPHRSDIQADALYLTLVQVALPRGLAIVSILAISAWTHHWAAIDAWPHSWPLAAQVILMVLAVDFLRYWLHRACHRFTPLWRLHEVHHSPEILYALNTGRFHPLEKALHFSVDTVPFLLVGVAPEVIAGYFLLYAVNGFFQHSNVDLRYGWLNYFVASAETHRWHHARDPRIAHCNFSNTTIVWDLVFGTWYLPKDRSLRDIGILDRHYPRGFWAQLSAPFRERTKTRRKSARRWIADALIALRLWAVGTIGQWKIARTVRRPMESQQRVLRSILRLNASTTFGRRHGFDAIKDYQSYARQVPVAEYQDLRPFIEAEIERGEAALTHESPTLYARTSGSTDTPKDIPLTLSYLRALRRIHHASVACQFRTCPEAFSGGIMAIVSPAFEGALANGKPYGSASGMVAGSTPALVQEKFVVPAAVLTIKDSQVKYLLILRLALGRSDVSYLGSANSATLLALIKLFREHQTQLIEDLRQGTFFLSHRVPAEVWSIIRARLRPKPERARELEDLQARGSLRLADLLPNLRLVVTWMGGSAGVTIDSLRRELSPRTRLLELGYLASEFRATVTIGRQRGSGLLTFDTHFFEFAEREAWDRGEREFLTLNQIRKGVDYYIIVTTPSGLYRYFINDVVRVRGKLHETPLIQFVQKGKGVTNITGEKLYEAQVISAVRSALVEMGRTPQFVMMLADEEARQYLLYVEPDAKPDRDPTELSAAVDSRLMKLNIEYASKRESNRLEPIRAAWLAPGTGEAYKRHCVQQGQREGQFKATALSYRKGFGFDLNAFAVGNCR